jgi:hypothetical protein
LPVSFSVAVAAVALDAGIGSAGTMALSAGAHVPAQVLFGVVFAWALNRRGVVLGVIYGTLAYAACSIAIADAPHVVALAAAIPVLALAPRVMPQGRPRRGSSRHWSSTALTCAAAPLIVAAALVTSRLAGSDVAGAVAAFPTMCTMLAVAIVSRDGAQAGAHSLTGLVRSLPCYLAFCIAVGLALPAVGLVAIGLGVLACMLAARATWSAVPVASERAVVPGNIELAAEPAG